MKSCVIENIRIPNNPFYNLTSSGSFSKNNITIIIRMHLACHIVSNFEHHNKENENELK